MEKLFSAVRHARIREHFSRQPGASIAELAREFGVSEMTIRRDLTQLESTTQIRRTRGGAVLTERMMIEFGYRERRDLNRTAKRGIAAEARRLIQPGHRIILDAGTTTLELAALLSDGEQITVITPSLAVASELQQAPGVEVILLGGAMRRGSPDLTGPLTEHCLAAFSADLVFQGADGIGTDGTLYNADLRLARVDQVMRNTARQCAILADSTKIGATALARCGTLAEADFFITDDRAPGEALRRYGRLGVKVIAA